MKYILFSALFAALLGPGSLMLTAQEQEGKKGPKPKDKKERKGEDEGKREKGREGDDDKGGKNKECGIDRDEYKKDLNKKGKGDDDSERETAEHFKKNHPDGRCHCSCHHGDGDKPEAKHHKDGDDDNGGKKKDCGLGRDDFKKALKKKGAGDDDCERETAEHFKNNHPDGGPCHCSCDHTAKQKGNNGVGNGVDPQPPGNPPVNDGPGTGPGQPGNKGGHGKGKGKN